MLGYWYYLAKVDPKRLSSKSEFQNSKRYRYGSVKSNRMAMDAATAEATLAALNKDSLQRCVDGVKDYNRVTMEIATAIRGLERYVEATGSRVVSDGAGLHLNALKENIVEFTDVVRQYEVIPDKVLEAIDVKGAAATDEDDGGQQRPLRRNNVPNIIPDGDDDHDDADNSPNGSSDTSSRALVPSDNNPACLHSTPPSNRLSGPSGHRSLRRNSTGSAVSSARRLFTGQSPSSLTSEYGGIENGGSYDDLADIAGDDELNVSIDSLDGMSENELKKMVRHHRLEILRLKDEYVANWMGNDDSSPIRTPDSLRRARNISPTEKSWGSWANGSWTADVGNGSARKLLRLRASDDDDDGDMIRSDLNGDGDIAGTETEETVATEWEALWRADGTVYYYNSAEDKSSWEAPAESQTWIVRTDAEGEKYYEVFLSQDERPADDPLVFVLDDEKKESNGGTSDGGNRTDTDTTVGVGTVWTAFLNADRSISYRKTEDKLCSTAPEGSQTWIRCTDDEGGTYYEMVKSQRERPASGALVFILEEEELSKVKEAEAAGTAVDRSPAKAPPGWSKHRNGDGTSYYHNPTTGATQWERPVEKEKDEQEEKEEEAVGVAVADAVAEGTAEAPTAAASGRSEVKEGDSAKSNISSYASADDDSSYMYDGEEDAGMVRRAKKKTDAAKKELAATMKPDHVVVRQTLLVGNDDEAEKEGKEDASSGNTNTLNQPVSSTFVVVLCFLRCLIF